MATTAEIKAAIAKAEAAGRMDLADKLRARMSDASDAQPAAPDASRIEAAIAKAEAAGRKDLADMLRAKMPTAPAAAPAMAGPAVAMYADGDPRNGTPAMTATARKPDTFGETAGAMMEGPIAAMGQFAGGLTGANPSPSREFLANDPLTRNLPPMALSLLGGVGDIGGAALSTVGAGISGATGLAAELMPGQNSQGERKLAEDLTGMAMFAVPELAGVSSLAGRAATMAPRAAETAAAVVPKIAEDVAAARRLGIPVMRTDVKPPSTFFGGVAQKTGEAIPIAGTGRARASQQGARISAAQKFAREYGADSAAPAIDDVTAGLLEKRSADLQKFTTQKREVIEGLADKGTVPVPKAVAAIDGQIAKLRKQNMAGLDPVIAKLEEFKTAITDQRLTEIEANRAVIGEAFSGLDMGAIRGTGEKALSAVYGPLRDDMATFIKSVGGQAALNKWGSANAKLSEMAGELGNSTLKRSLSKGEASPETVRSMLFSAKPSDVKLLYQNLPEKGKASARTAIVQEALAKAGGLDDLSPDKFKQALGKLGNQVGVFFKGDDFAAADGLLRALQLTERAGKAGVAPLTGVQNLPAVVGTLVGTFTGSLPATVGILGTIGGLARVYEATGVRSALRALAKADTPKGKSNALRALDKAIADAGVPVGTAGAQTTAAPDRFVARDAYGRPLPAPDYEPLWQRYGGQQ